jgi:DNA-binding MarR family transcriptional regulator
MGNWDFDENITSPARLSILAALAPGESLSFTDLKRKTGLADGNLHVQTHKLEAVGYLEIQKSMKGRRSFTQFHMTELGLERLKLHVRKLQSILKSADGVIVPVLAGEREDDSQVWS